ncbi:MAG: substrate-binding domain-containing protein [Acidobacteriota bacterium]
MNRKTPFEKIDQSSVPAADADAEEVSVITNIKIDATDADRSSADRSLTGTGGLRTPGRTTLALDPKPYRRRERFYFIIIIVLTLSVLVMAGTLLQFQQVLMQSAVPAANWEIVIAGVETNRRELERRAEKFMQNNAGTLVTIESGGSALTQLVQKRVQIAQTTHKLSDLERQRLGALAGRPIQQVTSAWAALAVYVHRENPIEELTLAQLRAIYTGEITSWQALGGPDMPILLYSPSYLSEARLLFRERVLGEAATAATLISLQDIAAVPAQVAVSTNAIGYGDASISSPQVRIIKLKSTPTTAAMAPFKDNVPDNTYPLTHEIYWYVLGTPQGTLKTFLGISESRKE